MSEPVAYINVEERKLEWANPMAWHTPTIAQMDKIPLYTHPAKTLTELEFENIVDACDLSGDWDTQYDFSKMFKLVNEAILRKAQEK